MSSSSSRIRDLETLNRITETLNRAVDIKTVLESALQDLVSLMGLESGWIFLRNPTAQELRWGRGYELAAHHNLPPALALDNIAAWDGGCDCQTKCNQGDLKDALNEVQCSRLVEASGDRKGLAVHASAPLRSGEHTLGILNVAADDWSSFSVRALALLTNIGSQMGVALERARLYDSLREQRIDEQAALLDLSNTLLSHIRFDELLQYVVDIVRTQMDADACALCLATDEPGEVEFQAVSGWKTDPIGKRVRFDVTEQAKELGVIQTSRQFVAEDLSPLGTDTDDLKLLAEEGFRGHATVPLIVEDRAIGVLVINSRNPRRIDDQILQFMQLMANQGAIAIENASLQEERIRRQRLEEELIIGRDIQLSLLPEHLPTISGWEFAKAYLPAQEISGDFYDYFEIPGDRLRLGLVIADVMGKGVPAALFMAMCRTTIRSTAISNRTPSEALFKTNELILKDSQANLYLSAVYAILDPTTGRLDFTIAGHNRPLIARASKQDISELQSTGIILGAFDEIRLEGQSLVLEPGDTLLLYTDGVTEAVNATQEHFGEERLKRVLSSNRDSSSRSILSAVLEAVESFEDPSGKRDDRTLLVVKREAEDV
jgi:sigma-B regulation protein RsbU (phosphoserine phosphatase)